MLIGTNAVTVGIYWCIPGGDYLSTFRITLNSTDVTSQFSDDSYGLQPPPDCQGPDDWWAHWSGTVAVPPGLNHFTAQGWTPDNYAGYGDAYFETPTPRRAVSVSTPIQELPIRIGGSYVQYFTVTNTSAATDSFNLSFGCPGAPSCTPQYPSRVILGAGQSIDASIGVLDGIPTIGATGRVQLVATSVSDATVKDSSWANVTVTDVNPTGVALVGGGDVLDRDLCLTAAVERDVAYECGDLRVAHLLPGVRSMNRMRAPTLLFDSQHANPFPLVSADVTLPGSEALPDSVQATLTINGSAYTQSWRGSDWSSLDARAPQGPKLTPAMLSVSGMGISSLAAIVDGDTTTPSGFYTDNSVPGAYLQIDLGKPYPLSTLGIWAGIPYIGIFDIKYSDDGSGWFTAYSGYSPIPGWSAASWPTVGAHRYWRLVLTNTPGNGSWLRELSVDPAQFSGGPPPSLSSSMVTTSGVGIGSLAAIVDGDTTTLGWYTDSSVPGAYVQLDLGASYPLQALGIWTGTPSYAVYDVKYSNDASNWSTAATGYRPTPGWSFASWGPVGKHRYWRIVLTNTPGNGAWFRELSVDAMQFARATVSSPTRRIAIGFDGSSLTTGLYSYHFDVRRVTSGSSTLLQSVSGSLPIVNRIQSPFGAGWWLAGLERLQVNGDGTLFWVGGDGSTRLYRAAGSGIWTATNVTRPDSIVWDGTYYNRKLPNNLRVRFDATGLHVATINRLGQTTSFGYSNIAGRTVLSTIDMPVVSGQLRYTFQYNGNGQLTTILSPGSIGGSRTSTVTVNTSVGRIDAIQDPDLNTVHFGYDASFTRRIISRTDRRNFTTGFRYDNGGRLIRDSLMLADQSIIGHDYQPVETIGLAGTTRASAAPVDSAYAELDGPRVDVADVRRFWFTPFGATARFRDPLGHETKVNYGDSNWPGLATEVRDPMLFITRATYNSRGLPSSIIAVSPLGGGDATTTYGWDAKWNLATSITSPMGVVTTMAYDSTTGNRKWQQVGGDSTRVNFSYYNGGATGGMLAAITAPGTNPDSLFYDGTLGNLAAGKGPNGARTSMYADALGRDTLVVSPIDATHDGWTRTSYDAMDRLSRVVGYGPAMPVNAITASFAAAADSFVVANSYDADGNLVKVTRSRGVSFQGQADLTDTSAYDGAGRKTFTATGSSKMDRYVYDLGGNVVQHQSGNGVVYTIYDAAGQAIQRVTPEVDYSATSCTTFLSGCTYSFPTFGGSAVCVSADTAFFRYDADGRVLQADNVYAHVHRTYKPNGLVASEAQSIRSYYSNGTSPCEVDPQGSTPTLFGNHNSTLTYGYDLDGRRTSLTHPAGTQTYSYDTASPSTGWLTGVTDIASWSYGIYYDAAGHVHEVSYPGGVNEVMTYGSDGRLSTRDIPNVAHDVFWYDERDRVDSVYNEYRAGVSSGFTARTWYNGLGAVSYTENYGYAGGWTERFTTDALGNRVRTQQQGMKPPTDPDYYGIRFSTYDGDGKLTVYADTVIPQSDPYTFQENYQYDGAGNLSLRYATETDFQNNRSGVYADAAKSYYGADGMLRVFNRQVGYGTVSDDSRQGHRGVFEEYRYDALGRRVMVRSRRGSVCANNEATYGIECAAYMERTVWDGDQVLLEDRADGSDGLSAAALDLETSSGDPYGRVVYAHGSGLDSPLSVTKGSTVVMPHANWQGQYEVGTLADGRSTATCGCLTIDWPGGKTMGDGEKPPQSAPVYVWFGNLITNKADGSGQLYMRNRYYDPRTGRFTQQDPIGLGGGLNTYGFVGGDPVNYSDPFGLCPPKDNNPCSLLQRTVQWLAPDNKHLNEVANKVTEVSDRVDKVMNAVGLGDGECHNGLCEAGVGGAFGGPGGDGLAKGMAKTVARAQGAKVTFSQLGKLTRAMWEVAGEKGAGYVKWNRVLNEEGSTIRLFKDVYGQAGNYLRRDWYVGGPPK